MCVGRYSIDDASCLEEHDWRCTCIVTVTALEMTTSSVLEAHVAVGTVFVVLQFSDYDPFWRAASLDKWPVLFGCYSTVKLAYAKRQG